MNKLQTIFFLISVFAFNYSLGNCEDPGYYVFISSNILKRSMRSDEALIKSQFDRCNVVVGGSRDVLSNSFDILLNVRKRVIYRNINDLEIDLHSGVLAGVVDIVIYNPEPGFSDTPIKEKNNPIEYSIRFARLARENGLLSVAAPSCRLVKERDTYQRFRICAEQIYSKIAPYYDFIDIQVQAEQGDSVLYERIIRYAAGVIRSSSDKTKIIAQVSTADAINGNANTMGEALAKVKNIVDGFWINVDNKSPDGKHDFIELISKYNLN